MICKSTVALCVLFVLIYSVTSATENTDTKVEEKVNVPALNPIIERSSLHHHHDVHDPTHHGFWKKKFTWRPRWVKTWQEKKVYVAVWKRMWGPVEVNEWVPLPKPPPGWIKHDVSSYVVKGHPH